MTFRSSRLLSSGFAIGMLFGSGPALTYDGLPWPVVGDLGFTLYGQINRSYLNYTKGFDRRGFFTGDDSTYLDLSRKYERETRNWVYSASLSITGLGDNEYAGIASFAYIHKASGINVTFTGTYSTTDQHDHCFKGGIVRQIFAIGSTALSVDWYNNGNWAADYAETETFGVSLVQDDDAANLQLYATIRHFDT